MSEFDTRMVDALAAADEEKRNTRIQKYCSFCGQEFLAEQDDTGTLCEECMES